MRAFEFRECHDSGLTINVALKPNAREAGERRERESAETAFSQGGFRARQDVAVVEISPTMNESDSPSPAWTVCTCNNCSGHLEFEASHASETIQCPHCGLDTVLFIPQGPLDSTTRAEKPPPKRPVKPPVLSPLERWASPPESDFERFARRASTLVACGWTIFCLAIIAFLYGLVKDTTDTWGKPDPGKIQEAAAITAAAASASGFGILLVISGWIIEALAWIGWLKTK